MGGDKRLYPSRKASPTGYIPTKVFLRAQYLDPFCSLYINDLQHILKVEGDDDRKDKGDRLQHFFYADNVQIKTCE